MTESTSNTKRAEGRSIAYGFLAAIFEYPEGELASLVRFGTIAEQAKQIFCPLYPELLLEIDWAGLRDAGEADALAIEYTRLFDVVSGAGGALCPLYGADYHEGMRLKLLEELVRFYNFFGLTAEGAPANERPDHLSAELDFMHFLCIQEAQSLSLDDYAEDYRRAQADFLVRHPGLWAAQLRARLIENRAKPYFLAAGQLLDSFFRLELKSLAAVVSSPSTQLSAA